MSKISVTYYSESRHFVLSAKNQHNYAWSSLSVRTGQIIKQTGWADCSAFKTQQHIQLYNKSGCDPQCRS